MQARKAKPRDRRQRNAAAREFDEHRLIEPTLGRELGVTDDFVTRALDPRAFVDARTLPGGPAKAAMQPFLERARQTLLEDNTWHRAENSRLRRAVDALEGEIDAVLREQLAVGV